MEPVTQNPFDSLGSSPLFNMAVMLDILFLLLLGIYVAYSAILVYHWKAYGIKSSLANLTLIIYFVSTIPLIILMGVIALTN